MYNKSINLNKNIKSNKNMSIIFI